MVDEYMKKAIKYLTDNVKIISVLQVVIFLFCVIATFSMQEKPTLLIMITGTILCTDLFLMKLINKREEKKFWSKYE